MGYKRINQRETDKNHVDEFSLLFNALDEYVLVMDKDGIILNTNKSALFRLEYTFKEIYGMNLSHIYLSKSIDEIREMIRNMMEGRISKYKMQLCTKSKTQISVEACIFIAEWKEKTVIYAICKEDSESTATNVLLKVVN